MDDYVEYAERDITVVDAEGNVGEQYVYLDSEGNSLVDTWVTDAQGNYAEEIDILSR